MILLLTAGFGDGHNTAARNIALAWERESPDEPVQIVDLFDRAHPFLSPLMKRGYQGVITMMPKVWSVIYRRSAALEWEDNRQYFIPLKDALSSLLDTLKPRLIISTYPIYSKLLEEVSKKRLYTPPIFTVVTDSTSIHPTWFLAPSQRCFVADQTSKQSAMALGVPSEKLEVTGFPVNLEFVRLSQATCASQEGGKLLYMPSTEARHVKATLEALVPILEELDVSLTLPLGKHHARLFHTVRRFQDRHPQLSMEVMGWTQQIPYLLHSHDVVICKAGGAILHESLAACCPAVIDFIVPGQEEGNANCLVNLGGGVIAKDPQETAAAIRRLFLDQKAEARSMKAKMKLHAEPEAALKIVRSILGKRSA